MTVNRRFDVVVIGAGPAGSRTAAQIARGARRVLLLEKRPRVGYPVRCAEAVGPREDIERYLPLDGRLVSSPINGFLIVAPDGTRFRREMPGIGFVVDRELFDRRLADDAVSAGAELRTGHQAMGLEGKYQMAQSKFEIHGGNFDLSYTGLILSLNLTYYL